MKLIIDINEDTYKDIKRGKVYSSVHEVPQESVLAIQTGTPIPDNATNGDVIKTMFQNSLYEENAETGDNENYVCMHNGIDSVCDFDLRWWNALYQKGKNK